MAALDSLGQAERSYLELQADSFRSRVDELLRGAEDLRGLANDASKDVALDLDEVEELIQEIKLACAMLLSRMESLLNGNPESQTPAFGGVEAVQGQAALSMSAALGSLLRELEILELRLRDLEAEVVTAKGGSAVPAVQPPRRVRDLTNFIGSQLIPLLKGALRKLWNLIGGLLRPREWSINGELSVAPFGLAKAGASITFGPSSP